MGGEMLVKDLIERLQKQNPNDIVYCGRYDDGKEWEIGSVSRSQIFVSISNNFYGVLLEGVK